MNSAFLTFQSRLLIWSDKIAPFIEKLSGIKTSKGYPFILLVIGQAMKRLDFALYAFGERTNAGLLPACLCPACMSKTSQTASQRSGT